MRESRKGKIKQGYFVRILITISNSRIKIIRDLFIAHPNAFPKMTTLAAIRMVIPNFFSQPHKPFCALHSDFGHIIDISGSLQLDFYFQSMGRIIAVSPPLIQQK